MHGAASLKLKMGLVAPLIQEQVVADTNQLLLEIAKGETHYMGVFDLCGTSTSTLVTAYALCAVVTL